ncbi:MFS transporter [Marinoscillum pacificum]|uniref:MFS transporter n=1 Tax=Marinoscillum pacificum TaxID=392723 RepID=UPI002157827C|nr:MFS transporter [Marinoscillum pacificum]
MATHLKFFFKHRDSLFIGLVFTCNSLLFGNWITRIPNIKDAIGLSEAELGLALLGAPIGSLLMMPFSGWIISRLEVGRTVLISGLLHTCSLILISLAGSFWAITLALAYYGFMNALMNISMNAAVASIEKAYKKPIMSTCHGMWSIGAMLGAAFGSITLGLELKTIPHLVGTTVSVALILLSISGTLFQLKEAKNQADKVFALPKGALLLLSFLAFCILLSEGAIADWSAIYMRDVIQSDPFLYGVAYSGFALFMTVGRLSGDALIPMIGKKKLVLYGGIVSSIGLAIAVSSSSPFPAIAGFSLTGLGFSCIVPVLFISAANEPGYSSGTGIAAVTTLGTAGFLVGPPLIGLLAEWYSLNLGLAFVLFCAVLVSLLSLAIKFR